ncbi:MAG: hypothetical protein LUI04_06040 [Porphyromonadaceae bacterium]|nr:hypothetical protein [Porphyromonadaceae bacterium]
MKKIAVKNYYMVRLDDKDADSNLYEADLGWGQYDYDEAMADTPEDVLRYYLDVVCYDVYFFSADTFSWYWIDNRGDGYKLSLLPTRPDWDGMFLEGNYLLPGKMPWPDDIPNVIFKADTLEEFIKGARIGGKTIGEALNRASIYLS